jgi:hypothetical protein
VKDQRYRIFIAHDALELGQLATDISYELVKHRCIPLGIGLRPSADNHHWDIIRAMIDESDALILLVGNSYGELSPSGVSYVHMAYIYASTQGKKIFPLCQKSSDGDLSNAHLNEFKKLLSSHEIRYWTVEAELRKQLLLDIRKIRTRRNLGLIPIGQVSETSTLPLPAKEASQLTVVPPVISEVVAASTQNAEILQLRKELEEARRALASPQTTSEAKRPKVKSKNVMVSYSAKVFTGGNFKTITEACSMSWDAIFLAVAPHMLSPVSEEKMRLVISAALATEVQTPIKTQYPNSHAVADIRLSNDSMNRIKIHLRGQDLIKEIMQGRDIRWKLTKSGDQHLTELYSKQSVAGSSMPS